MAQIMTTWIDEENGICGSTRNVAIVIETITNINTFTHRVDV